MLVLLIWIVVGLTAGFLDKVVVCEEHYSDLGNGRLAGIAGATFSGSLFSVSLGYHNQSWIVSSVVAGVGALIGLLIFRTYVRSHHSYRRNMRRRRKIYQYNEKGKI